jgi:signal transduction histidine kinase
MMHMEKLNLIPRIRRHIPGRKSAEQMLQEYGGVVESSEELIVVIDRGYQYLQAFRSHPDQRGLERGDRVRPPVSGVLGEEFFKKVVKAKLDECFQGNVVRYEMKAQYPRLGEKDVLVSYFPIQGSQGVDRALCVMQDITGRKRVEEEIRNLNQDLAKRTAELAAANNELEAFTCSVSHDLRAPLRHVEGLSKLLVEKHRAELSPDAREYVTTIRDSVLQMGRWIDDLVNLAWVGGKQLSLQVTGLNSLAEEVITDLKRSNPDRRIDWKIETLPCAECDPVLVKQVFANLLSNAVKFTRPRKPAVIEVGVTDRDGACAVFVRDNGVGFSMKYANKLFGVSQRLHRSGDFEGTGVGLATVQRIIHKHGGRVWAEGELNEGATFYFTLGMAKAEDSRQKARGTEGEMERRAA